MNKIEGFPTRYDGSPEPIGLQWITKCGVVRATCEKGGTVALCGGHGTGKTRMAYEIAKHGNFPKAEIKKTISDNSYFIPAPAVYTTAMMLFIRLRDSFCGRADKPGLAIIKEFSEASLVVIDELQDRGETAFEDQIITAIVDARYQHGRPTILIANLPQKTLAAKLSPSLISRIRENGGFVDCNWPSYRTNP